MIFLGEKRGGNTKITLLRQAAVPHEHSSDLGADRLGAGTQDVIVHAVDDAVDSYSYSSDAWGI